MESTTCRKPLRRYPHKVSILHDKDPKYPYRVQFPEGEKRRRKYFTTKSAAEKFAKDKSTELEKRGNASTALKLSESDLGAIADELPFIEDMGHTLRDALEFYSSHLQNTMTSTSVKDAVPDFLMEKKRSIGKLALRDYRLRLGRFSESFGSQSLATVSASQITDWLYSLKVSPVTMGNFARELSTFFRWACERKKWCSSNPVAEVELPRVAETEIGILTPDETRHLLLSAPSEVLPYLALGIFAGIRVEELQRLDWSAIDLEQNIVRITSSVGKGKRKRQVPISANLRVWLTAHRRTGPVALKNLRRDIDKARVAAGFKPSHYSESPQKRKQQQQLAAWPRNAMRHSFGSYRLQETQNNGQVALEMGNSPQTVMKHYRELVLPRECEAFWNIRPDSDNKVVSFVG